MATKKFVANPQRFDPWRQRTAGFERDDDGFELSPVHSAQQLVKHHFGAIRLEAGDDVSDLDHRLDSRISASFGARARRL